MIGEMEYKSVNIHILGLVHRCIVFGLILSYAMLCYYQLLMLVVCLHVTESK
eukprot:JP446430.1.p6 GENE.JP446430.1~~JP446430.1.p6  ORF type:complete len:52 (+),score=2.67 JP446430.1:842-997(+)